MLADGDDSHAESGGMAGGSAADAAQSDHPQSGACDFPRMREGFPQLLLSPNPLLLKASGLVQFLGQSQDQRDDVFADDRAVNVAAIGDDDVAIDQLRKEKLMHRRCRRMKPA